MGRAASNRCRGRTQAGQPCRAWAVRGSDPPLCPAHAASANPEPAAGESEPARLPRFYAQALEPEEIADLLACADNLSLEDEIACARVALRRVLSALASADALAPGEYARLAGLAFQGTRTVARLLRERRALSGEAAEGLAGALAQALDELASEWGIEL